MRLRITQQLASSLFFLGFGAVALWLSTDMTIGTAAEMGVGYVPRLLAIGCILVGVLQFLTGLVRSWGETATIELRPLAFVVALIMGFAGLLPFLGLPLTVFLLVLAAALSGEALKWPMLLLSALLLAAGTGVLFGLLLRLQIPIWPMGWRL